MNSTPIIYECWLSGSVGTNIFDVAFVANLNVTFS